MDRNLKRQIKRGRIQPEPTVGKIYGYVRVSTTMQVEDGISLDTQTNRINTYCENKKVKLEKLFEDKGISGKTIQERPGLQEALSVLKQDDRLVVQDLSRFSRNTKDAIQMLMNIKEKGASLVLLSPDVDFSSPVGTMFFTMLSAVSQLESEQIGERVSVNMKTLSNRNELRSKPQFGWKFIGKGKDYVQDESQQPIIQLIVDLYESGESYTKIAQILNEKGHNKTLKNKKNLPQIFYPNTVRNVLANEGIIKVPGKKPITERFLKTRNPDIDEGLIDKVPETGVTQETCTNEVTNS